MTIHVMDPDNPSGGSGGSGGGGTLPPVTPPTSGTTNIPTIMWADVSSDHTEAQPTGQLTGFEVAIFSGSSMNVDNGFLATEIISVPDPTARRWVEKLTLRTRVLLKAAVRAVYGTRGKSTWVYAPVITRQQTFQPQNVPLGTGGVATMRKLPDGTIFQFLVTGLQTVERDYSVTWLQAFPNECLNVNVTCEDTEGSNTNDNWYQLRSFSTTGAVIRRQSSTDNTSPTRAHIMAIGY